MLNVSSINTNLPIEVRSKIDETYNAIRSGELKPFTGPIKDNSGKLVVEANHTLTDIELSQVNWYVEGIKAKMPN